MKKIEDAAALVFIAATTILSAIVIVNIWHFLADYALLKSVRTLALVGFVWLLIEVVGRMVESHTGDISAAPAEPNLIFKKIRQGSLLGLVCFGTLFVFTGVLSIWNVISDGDVFYKSVGSLTIVAFAVFVVIIACLEREKHLFVRHEGRHSVGAIILYVILGLLLIGVVSNFVNSTLPFLSSASVFVGGHAPTPQY